MFVIKCCNPATDNAGFAASGVRVRLGSFDCPVQGAPIAVMVQCVAPALPSGTYPVVVTSNGLDSRAVVNLGAGKWG